MKTAIIIIIFLCAYFAWFTYDSKGGWHNLFIAFITTFVLIQKLLEK
jgi:hypothetical protein